MKNKIIKVSSKILEKEIIKKSNKYTSLRFSKIIAKLIIRSEKMNILTHGLHYFVHSAEPHLANGLTKHKILQKKNYLYSVGENGGGLGIVNTYDCLNKASLIAKKTGVCVYSAKNPGKIGALRIYCPEIIKKNQLILLMKNTAPTQGLKKIKKAIIGTNPLSIGIPGSDFIYDSSTSTVATNAIRLKKKYSQKFKHVVGFDKNNYPTNDPNQLLENKAFLNTFADGQFWYKSFYLGMAIEFIGALCGGKTSYRVGKHKGKRLFSKEGLLAIIIDKKTFPNYRSYIKEIKLFLKDIKKSGLRIPGTYNDKQKYLYVLKADYNKLKDSN